MKELFRKYLDDQCSPDEVKELLKYFDISDNEAVLRELILEALEEETAEEEDDDNRWQSNTSRSLDMINQQLNINPVKKSSLYHNRWFRVAAAVVSIAVGISIYRIINKAQDAEEHIVKNEQKKLEIGPATSKANLLLSNGSMLELENIADGQLAVEGNTAIIKSNRAVLTYTSSDEQKSENLYNRVTTPRGGIYQLTLSDGTKVWLNAGSQIYFPVAFSGNKRSVDISGEVYFEVAENPNKPFIVNVNGKVSVQVLGTAFNVSAYNEDEDINTSLLKGSVRISALKGGETAVLNPGQRAELTTGGQLSVKDKIDTAQMAAWKNGLFAFNDASIETVLKQVSRWYDIEVVFEGNVPQGKFDGEIQRILNLTQIIKLLEKNNIHFRLEGRKLFVYE